jgi:hypothetical protein
MIEAGRPSISAVDMHKYALELAEERPLAALLYICLLYYTVTLLHRKGPIRDDDFDTHLSMVRFSISKYCCNHSTLYLRIAMDELQYCFTWSECEEKVYKSGIFTGETANGEPAPRDYIHEKTIRALSEQVGKTHKPGRDHYVEWAAFNVKDVAQNKKAMERMRAGGYDEENRQKMFTHDATAFAVATIALERSEIFKKSATGVKIKGKMYKYDKLYSPLDGSILTSDILKVKSMGQSRADNYATNKYNIESQNCNKRTEKDMGIPEIKATSAKTSDIRKRVILRAAATSEKSIDKSGTKQQLLVETERFRRFDGIVIPDVNASASKPVIVKTLLRLRKRVFKKFDKAKDELIKEALRELPGTDTTPAERKAELQEHLFTFPPSILAIPRFNVPYIHESL